MKIEVSRSRFEELTRDLLERTETTTSLVVKQAGLDWRAIDRVLLVGGSSRMPMVARMLERVTGKIPDASQSPDEAVAHGAALYAGMLTGQKIARGSRKCELINVNSHSLGVVGMHGRTKELVNVVLIPKNTSLPCRAVRTFKTARADQRSVKVSVVEGENPRPEACIALGECIVRDLPPGLPLNSPVEVEYAYHANGRLAVTARVPSVRYSQRIEIKRDGKRSLNDLDSWRRRLCGQPEASVAIRSTAPTLMPQADDADAHKKLDALYTSLGKIVVSMSLPQTLERSRRTAADAMAECARAQAALKQAEQARQAGSLNAREVLADQTRLAQAAGAAHQMQVRADFCLLVLGRDCVNAGFEPPGAEKLLADIRYLRQ